MINDAENKLSPCPFCGGEAYVKSAISLDDLNSGHVIISCFMCFAAIQGQTVAQEFISWECED